MRGEVPAIFKHPDYDRVTVYKAKDLVACTVCGVEEPSWRVKLRLSSTGRPCNCKKNGAPDLIHIEEYITHRGTMWRCYVRS